MCVAVKAGGMRIVQKHQPTATPEPPQKDDDEEEYVASKYGILFFCFPVEQSNLPQRDAK